MAVINIDDAYILGETGAQVDKVTGLFTKDEDTTEEEKEFAQLNIGASGGGGGGGRNLFDNGWFTVNQRSATTVTLNGTEAYIADRWIAGSFGTYTRNSDNTITITCPNSTSFAGLTQRIDPIYKGGTYTYSIRLDDDTVISLQGTMPSGSGLNIYNININGTAWQVLFRSDGSAYWVTLRCNVANTTITIKAVKLEPGSVSTLANDAPPDYGEELAKCQRYFLRLNSVLNFPYAIGIAHNASSLRLLIPTPTTMRKAPTVSFTGSLVASGNGSSLTVSALPNAYLADNGVALEATATGATQYQTYSLVPTSSGHIDLSADL